MFFQGSFFYLAVYVVIGAIPVNLVIVWIASYNDYTFLRMAKQILYIQLCIATLLFLIALTFI